MRYAKHVTIWIACLTFLYLDRKVLLVLKILSSKFCEEVGSQTSLWPLYLLWAFLHLLRWPSCTQKNWFWNSKLYVNSVSFGSNVEIPSTSGERAPLNSASQIFLKYGLILEMRISFSLNIGNIFEEGKLEAIVMPPLFPCIFSVEM